MFAYMRPLILLAYICTILTACAGTGDVIRTAAELQAATFDHGELGRKFDIEVRLVTSCKAGNEATSPSTTKLGPP